MNTYNTDSTDSWHNIFVAFAISVLLVVALPSQPTRLKHLVL